MGGPAAACQEMNLIAMRWQIELNPLQKGQQMLKKKKKMEKKKEKQPHPPSTCPTCGRGIQLNILMQINPLMSANCRLQQEGRSRN